MWCQKSPDSQPIPVLLSLLSSFSSRVTSTGPITFLQVKIGITSSRMTANAEEKDELLSDHIGWRLISFLLLLDILLTRSLLNDHRQDYML